MISAIRSGFQGMERACALVNAAASDVANHAPSYPNAPPPDGASPGDISQDMVTMTVGHRTYDANAKVIEVAARMLDTIV
jgi:hypothetical protein